ncbi:fimbrial protein [Vibrio harveyi]|uniref:F4 family fimbrial subunit n=1 Tax=Vibrio harveyi TaxID=669 RepID=UPI00237FE820|nr:fimbrial protein [Vibrio harveyi]
MKNTILAISLAAALGSVGSANAAFVDTTAGGFNGNIQFSGTISDPAPIWAFEIPDATKNGVKNWNVNKSDGVASGSNTTFSFSTKPTYTLIHGFMKTTARIGGPGLTPEIKVGKVGSEVKLDGTEQVVNIDATDTASSSNVKGSLSFKAIGYIGGAYYDAATPKYFGSVKAQQVLSTNRADFNTAYPSVAAGTSTFAQAETLMASTSSQKVSGAYTVDIKDYSLTFPTATIPTSWEATVPVVVTLK